MIHVARLSLEQRDDFARWQTYVLGREDCHLSDLGEWRLLYRRLYGFEDLSYLALEGERIVGCLSLYHINSPFTGKMLVSSPFFGHGGLHAESEAAREALLERALDEGRARNLDYIELRRLQALPEPYQANTDFAEYDLELPATPEEAWSDRLSSNVRQNIRKARAAGLEFRLTTSHAASFGLLRRTLRAHGTPFHGERFFVLLSEYFGERVRYSEVWHAGRLVAAGLALQFRDSLLTPYIGSLSAYRELRPNYAQYWGLVESCYALGVRRFELGRSPRGSTHAQFKRKWGATEQPLRYSYRLLHPARRYRTVSRPSQLEVLATRVWRRLPLALTGALGPRLFRYLP